MTFAFVFTSASAARDSLDGVSIAWTSVPAEFASVALDDAMGAGPAGTSGVERPRAITTTSAIKTTAEHPFWVKDKGWIEFSVYPLYSPQSLIAEGSANYGIDLAFPGPERLAYETRVLYPLAGLPTADAARYAGLQDAMKALAGARFTIARELLEGRIDEAEAARLAQRYQLISAARAKQSIAFTKQYRSYVINYGLGQDMVRTYVEAAGADPKAKWARMEKLLSEPTLPGDLAAR